MKPFLFKNIFSNQIINYLFTRYLTYFVQFITSIILAVKLGPYYSGIWGFIVLIINYFGQVDFGIANSLNVFLVQNKEDLKSSASYIKNALLLNILISLIVVLICGYNYFFGIDLIQKYKINSYFIIICLISILQYFNTLFMTIFRVYNNLMPIIINQSITVFLTFLIVFFFTNKMLVLTLISAYLVGNVLSIVVYLTSLPVSIKGSSFSLNDSKALIIKGFYLFMFNGSFYFIITSTRSLISNYYSVEEFGVFSFAYTLSNSIMLFFGAFSFLLFPKLIFKLSSKDLDLISNTINTITYNYTTFAHILIYICMFFFPFISWYFVEYSNLLIVLNFISLALLISTNSFAHITLLIAQNQERTAAIISLCSLLLNLFLGFIIVKCLNLDVEYVIIASGISFFAFAYLSSYFANLILQRRTTLPFIINDFFPPRLLLPYTLAIIVALFNLEFWILVVILFFFLLNAKIIINLIQMIKHVLSNSKIINI